jgi:hypothetical protein
MRLGCGWKYQAKVIGEPIATMDGWVYELKIISKSFYIFGIKLFTINTLSV